MGCGHPTRAYIEDALSGLGFTSQTKKKIILQVSNSLMTIFIQLQPVCCIIVLVQVWKNVPAKDAAPFVFPLSALAERTETMELSQKDT